MQEQLAISLVRSPKKYASRGARSTCYCCGHSVRASEETVGFPRDKRASRPDPVHHDSRGTSFFLLERTRVCTSLNRESYARTWM
jgi:hypothetical protein